MLRKNLDRTLVAMICLISLGVSGCQSDQDEPSLSTAKTLEQREIAFAKTMADRDVKAFQSFISPEAIFFSGNKPLIGSDTILKAWGPFFQGDTAPFSWYPDVIEVLESGNLGLTSGPVLSGSGEEIGRFNSIWRMDEDGAWRVVFDKGS